MPKDLRSFIAELEAKSPEEIARVNKPLSPRYEISALLTHLEKIKRFPLLFFEKVKGSDAPVVINAQAGRRLMAIALDGKPEELARKFGERQSKPIPPVEVTEAPVQEVTKLGDEADLTEVPMLTHYDVNAAPYITAGGGVAAPPSYRARKPRPQPAVVGGQRAPRNFFVFRPPPPA